MSLARLTFMPEDRLHLLRVIEKEFVNTGGVLGVINLSAGDRSIPHFTLQLLCAALASCLCIVFACAGRGLTNKVVSDLVLHAFVRTTHVARVLKDMRAEVSCMRIGRTSVACSCFF
jgi:hypothetical protein